MLKPGILTCKIIPSNLVKKGKEESKPSLQGEGRSLTQNSLIRTSVPSTLQDTAEPNQSLPTTGAFAADSTGLSQPKV